MLHYMIKLDQFSTKKPEKIDIPVDRIVSIHECAPLRLTNKSIPISRLLLSAENHVEYSYFIAETLGNIKSKIKAGFEEYLKGCNPDSLLALSLDEFPVFHTVSDIDQHALMMIPLNRIERYKNSHKSRCIITINGNDYSIDESHAQLTDNKVKLESELIQLMRNNKLI